MSLRPADRDIGDAGIDVGAGRIEMGDDAVGRGGLRRMDGLDPAGADEAIEDVVRGQRLGFAFAGSGGEPALRDGVTIGCSYDALERLTAQSDAWYATGSASFQYNAAGQIARRTQSNDAYAWGGAVTTDRGYGIDGLNRYTSSGSVALGYDGRGNLASSGGSAYGYTSENQLATGPGAALGYDALGRLFNVTSDGGRNTTLSYAGDRVLAELDQTNGAVLRRYVYGPGSDEPLIWYEGAGTGNRRFLHADERDSVIAVTDGSGNVSAIDTYDEFGIPGANNQGRFQYTGQKWLPALGLYDYKARTYSPTLGRFLQTDPIGYADGMNWYNYAGGDPVNGKDPAGLLVIEGQDVTVTGVPWYSYNNFTDILSLLRNSALVNGIVGPFSGSRDTPRLGRSIKKPQNGTPHKYVMPYINPCPASKVLGYFKQSGHGAPGALATTEGFTQRIVLAGNNPISQSVNSSTGTIVNTTLPGHMFYPGSVTIQVTPLSDQTSRTTITGVGTGADPWLNDVVGQSFFGAQASGAQNTCGR